MKNIGVFVNLSVQFYNISQKYRSGKMNYAAYLKQAVGEDTLYRAFAYGIQLQDEAQPFITALKQDGYEPKYKLARMLNGRPNIRVTDWNVGMAMDVVRYAPKLDTVILGSNDIDLIPLIQYLQERGVKVVIFSCYVDPELRAAADSVIEITEDLLEKRAEPATV